MLSDQGWCKVTFLEYLLIKWPNPCASASCLPICGCCCLWQRLPDNAWDLVNRHCQPWMGFHPGVAEWVDDAFKGPIHTSVEWLQLVRAVGGGGGGRIAGQCHGCGRSWCLPRTGARGGWQELKELWTLRMKLELLQVYQEISLHPRWCIGCPNAARWAILDEIRFKVQLNSCLNSLLLNHGSANSCHILEGNLSFCVF